MVRLLTLPAVAQLVTGCFMFFAGIEDQVSSLATGLLCAVGLHAFIVAFRPLFAWQLPAWSNSRNIQAGALTPLITWLFDSLQWFRSNFGLGGRWHVVRLRVVEAVEASNCVIRFGINSVAFEQVAIQIAAIFRLAPLIDSWQLLIFVGVVSLNLIVTPILTLAPIRAFKQELLIVFDTLLDVFYCIFNLVAIGAADIPLEAAISIAAPALSNSSR